MYSMHGMRKKLSEEGALNHILVKEENYERALSVLDSEDAVVCVKEISTWNSERTMYPEMTDQYVQRDGNSSGKDH